MSDSSILKISTCHPDRPHQGKGLCKICYLKQYRKDNPIKMREIHERRKLREKDCPIAKKKKFAGMIKRKYGITLNQYELMLEEQKGLCKICSLPPNKDKKLHIDHCHTTGRVRGLLCAQCNWFVGKVDKNLEIIEKLKEYCNGK